MSTESDSHDYRIDERKRRGSQPHIPLGAHQAPLLEQHHAPLNFARLHHAPLPHHDDPGYIQYKAARDAALAHAVRAFKRELGARCAVQHVQVESEKLIVRHYSQSKLSQQELADLQKATHFDKKELQQWYKGAHSRCEGPCESCLSTNRFP
jgi:hypothetical protein